MRIHPILLGILAVGCANKEDEERELSPFLDADQDGFGNLKAYTQSCQQPSSFVLNFADCDDTNPKIRPDAHGNCPSSP